MDILTTVVSEIIVCLVIAWTLGFITAWVLKKGPNKKLEEEVLDLREDLQFKGAYCRGLEKENANQAVILREYRENYNQEVLQRDTDI